MQARRKLRSVSLCLSIVATLAAGAAAQPAASARAAALGRARQALASSQAPEAIEIANQLLETNPADRDAAAVKVEALVATADTNAALDGYDGWRKVSGKDDSPMLAVLGRGRLRELGHDPTPVVSTRALQALAEGGDATARAALVKQARGASESAEGMNAIIAMAHLGDARAVGTLLQLATTGPPSQRTTLLPVVADVAGAKLAPLLAAALTDRDVVLRLTALSLAGERGVTSLVPSIKPLLDERPFIMALHAAVALKRLGDASGSAILDDALKSELADTRLLAASGFAGGKDGPWVGALTPLLDDPEVLVRLKAADLLQDRVPRAADVIRRAASDPNPAIRGEAAKVVASRATPDLAILAQLLRDQSVWVRLEAATRLTRPSAK